MEEEEEVVVVHSKRIYILPILPIFPVFFYQYTVALIIKVKILLMMKTVFYFLHDLCYFYKRVF